MAKPTPSAHNISLPQFHGCVDPRATVHPYCNTSLSISARVDNLFSLLTLEDKIRAISPARSKPTLAMGKESIGLPDYNWLTEANSVIQGDCVAPDKCPTQFPGSLNVAASFNRTSFFLKGSVLGTEIRALGNIRSKECFNCPGRMTPPLTAWGPNINIVRDPRFGRTSELPSEDPYLAGHYGAGMVRGFQQRDARGHVKALSYLKHYTMYSDQNQAQPGNVSMHDLHESYLRQYRIAFQQGGASGAMCCYDEINGVRACGNSYILNEVIREQWGMQDVLIGTDWGAMPHGLPVSSAAQALNAGVDLEMGSQLFTYNLGLAIGLGLTTEAKVDAAWRRAYTQLFAAGRFDPPESVAWASLGLEAVNSSAHRHVTHEAALQGFVLLRNEGVLPLRKGAKIAVVGPMGVERTGMMPDYGNGWWRKQNACYNYAHPGTQGDPGKSGRQGDPYCVPTIAASVARANAGGETAVAMGVELSKGHPDPAHKSADAAAALRLCAAAEVVVLALGIGHAEEMEGKDRTDTALPSEQAAFATQVLGLGKPTVLVLVNGGALAIDELLTAKPHGPGAVVEAFNVAFGAPALAATLFGDENRWGKLPVTLYPHSFVTENPMDNMDMARPPGRTYKYYTGAPLFPFGHGLSYTNFTLGCTGNATALPIATTCVVANTGAMDGDEVVLVYHVAGDDVRAQAKHPVPRRALVNFERVRVAAGAKESVTFVLTKDDVLLVDELGKDRLYSGKHTIVFSRGHGEEVSLELTV